MTGRAETSFPRSLRLLAAALAPDHAVGLAQLRADWTDQDFPALLALARRHRVMPGLAHALVEAGLRPPSPHEAMATAMLGQAAFHELALAATTRSTMEALDRAALPVVLLKGISLSLRLHGRLGLRTSRDVDLLVTPETANAALDTLEALGFRPISPLRPGALPALIRKRKDIELLSADGQQIVELHWRLFDNPHLMPLPDDLPTSLVELAPGLACRVLEDRLNLLYLANHGAQHGWSRLKWLADFAGLAHALGPSACSALYEATPYAEGRRALGQALLLSGELMGLPVPERLAVDAPRDIRLRALTAMARQILASSEGGEIEDLRFGSTRKTLSHYLIHAAPAYLLAEIGFDLTAFPASEEGSRWHRFGAAGRLLSWGQRHLR